MAPNGLEIATNTASVVINEAFKTIALYLGPKYLHLPEANQGMKEKVQSLKPNSERSRLLSVLMVPISLLYAPLNTLTIISVTNNSIHLSQKLYKITKIIFMDVEYKWPGSVQDTKV